MPDDGQQESLKSLALLIKIIKKFYVRQQSIW
jgi:hypothetical protein